MKHNNKRRIYWAWKKKPTWNEKAVYFYWWL